MGDSDRLRVELRVRDAMPDGVHDRQRAVYERLRSFEETDRIADVTVDVWGRQVRSAAGTTPAIEDATSRQARLAYEECEAWAEQHGHDLEPAFSTRTLGSLVNDDPGEVIRFPVITLTVYHDDELVAVAPCSTAEGVQTVEDCLDALAAGRLTPGGTRRD